jgi:hypothetical protein
MGILGELVVGASIAYFGYQLQSLDSKVDKAILEIEKLKLVMPKRSTD